MTTRRKYALYKRRHDAKPHEHWERISGSEWPRSLAVRVFQDMLIRNALGRLEPEYEYRIRPVSPCR